MKEGTTLLGVGGGEREAGSRMKGLESHGCNLLINVQIFTCSVPKPLPGYLQGEGNFLLQSSF